MNSDLVRALLPPADSRQYRLVLQGAVSLGWRVLQMKLIARVNEARNEGGIKQESIAAHSLLSPRLGVPYR